MTTRHRQCGTCTLCCKLLPTKEINKPANTRCEHQRHTGCAIYAKRPTSCALFSCRWLLNDDTDRLRRPDRSRYVIDLVPDFVEIVHNETGEKTPIEVVQVWCDPHERDAWRDPELLAYLDRRGAQGKAGIIRWSSTEAMTLFPPSMSSDGEWHEFWHGTVRPERTPLEMVAGVERARGHV